MAAGGVVMEAVSAGDATLLPVDSEPSAIFQCLQGQDRGGLARILLTASGGALKELTVEQLARVTPEQALRHPTWSMGEKITVDSATLMNKGLEVIEAHWLFGVPLRDIEIIIHPQSIMHSLVEFRDGSLLAQLGTPTMRTPIQYALGYPERLPHNWAPLDLIKLGRLDFAAPDFSRFPCPLLARQAALTGGTMPTVPECRQRDRGRRLPRPSPRLHGHPASGRTRPRRPPSHRPSDAGSGTRHRCGSAPGSEALGSMVARIIHEGTSTQRCPLMNYPGYHAVRRLLLLFRRRGLGGVEDRQCQIAHASGANEDFRGDLAYLLPALLSVGNSQRGKGELLAPVRIKGELLHVGVIAVRPGMEVHFPRRYCRRRSADYSATRT